MNRADRNAIRDAAETMIVLAEDIVRLREENAKLKRQNASLRGRLTRTQRERDEARTEVQSYELRGV